MSAIIRLVTEDDVEAISQLYRDIYGEDYPFKEFYDVTWIKRGVFDDEIRWYVAVDQREGSAGKLLGSAAVMLKAGDGDDQISELGRLVVHPDARGLGIGSKLVDAITEDADRVSDFAFAECRTAHLGSQLIFERGGYAIIGIVPLMYFVDGAHETIIVVCRLSEAARVLRKPAPRVIPEAHQLAAAALAAADIPVDVEVDSAPQPYPQLATPAELTLEPMRDAQRYRLIKLGRENYLSPEVFGAIRLEHGLLKLKDHAARHLVLRAGEAVLGGVGYTWDEVERKVRIFEIVAAGPAAKGTLLERALAWIEREYDPRLCLIDVNAHATRMQQSLHLLGYAPTLYAPSMVYVLGERFDVMRFVKLRMPAELSHWKLTELARPTAELGEHVLLAGQRGVDTENVVREIALFDGLSDIQLGEVAGLCRRTRYEAGQVVFEQGSEQRALYLVLDGAVEIRRGGRDEPLSTLRRGSAFGEMALIEAQPRSAAAVCGEPSELLVLTPEDFEQLTRTDPRAGVVILSNLARTLSERLRSTSDALVEA